MGKSKKHNKKRTGKRPIRFNPPAFSLQDELLSRQIIRKNPDFPESDEIIYELTADKLMCATLGIGEEFDPPPDYDKRPVNGQALASAIDIYQSAIEKLGIAMSQEQAMAQDIIDIRAMSEAIKADPILYGKHFDFMFARDPFFNAVPCFTKGTLIEPNESMAVWELLNIDVVKKEYTVKIQNYLYSSAFANKPQWFISDQVITTISTNMAPDGTTSYLFKFKISDICERPQMYRAISLTALGFTDEQRQAFNRGLITMSDWHHANTLARCSVCDTIFSQLSFVYVTTAINMFLEQQSARKPSAAKKAALSPEIQNLETKSKPEIQTESNPPERTVRVIDMLTFASTSIPRRPTEKTVVKYITPAWQVRGHVRHYKSGKTAYIQPHISRRKTMTDKIDTKRPQQIIRIRDNTDTFVDSES